ncbi:SurA N-terminal domain-containing protein [Alkalicoccus urumqiensis]|uniref:Peptidylprolyl isomerase n=1 Tax=Alkalicoccus urumqiensis TaxID=1548213 RepID=A0A2P6MKG5_ALKUR|nr:SurA N-terminal domain-containing protein [Alkalicoccus urumqiensis]PRO66780.1 hypothetical protein C6I21_02330 [Alkalicoccus urumqiensis]
MRKWTMSLSLGVLLFAAACSGNDENNTAEEEAEQQDTNTSEEEEEQASENESLEMDNTSEEMDEVTAEEIEETEADLPELMNMDPEETAIIVNGEEIPASQLQNQLGPIFDIFQSQEMEDGQMEMMMAQMQEQYLAQIVNQELMKQEAERQNIEADEEFVEEEYETIRSSFDSEEAFQEQMASLNYSEDQIREELRQVSLVEQLMESEDVLAEYEVSEEDVRSYYDTLSSQDASLAEEGFEAAKEDIENTLIQQEMLRDLNDQAEIEIML